MFCCTAPFNITIKTNERYQYIRGEILNWLGCFIILFVWNVKRKTNSPHLLPLKEGSEGNPPHLFFSLFNLHCYVHEMVCSMHNVLVHFWFVFHFILWTYSKQIAIEGYFPHLLPLKEGSEGNTPHLHFSLHYSRKLDCEAVQQIKHFFADAMVSFICFYKHVRECCAAKRFA